MLFGHTISSLPALKDFFLSYHLQLAGGGNTSPVSLSHHLPPSPLSFSRAATSDVFYPQRSLVKHDGCPCEGTMRPPKIEPDTLSFVHRYVIGSISQLLSFARTNARTLMMFFCHTISSTSPFSLIKGTLCFPFHQQYFAATNHQQYSTSRQLQTLYPPNNEELQAGVRSSWN